MVDVIDDRKRDFDIGREVYFRYLKGERKMALVLSGVIP